MTFLELCKQVRREAGISGVGPVSVVNQSGEMDRIVGWVNSAYKKLQRKRPNWNWMRAEFSFQTTASQYDYTPAQAGITERFSQWDVNTITSYRTSLGVSNEFELSEVLYSRFRSAYLVGSKPEGSPICFSLAPDQKLLLGPNPDGIFTVSGQYWKSPQILAADDDVPEMPEQFHELIVWMALKAYGLYESAGEVIARAQENITSDMGELERNQLPDIEMPGPLA